MGGEHCVQASLGEVAAIRFPASGDHLPRPPSSCHHRRPYIPYGRRLTRRYAHRIVTEVLVQRKGSAPRTVARYGRYGISGPSGLRNAM